MIESASWVGSGGRGGSVAVQLKYMLENFNILNSGWSIAAAQGQIPRSAGPGTML